MSSLNATTQAFALSAQNYPGKKLPAMQLMSLAASFQGKSQTQQAAEAINLSKTEIITTNTINNDSLKYQPKEVYFATAPAIQLTPNPNPPIYMGSRPKSASAQVRSQAPSQIGALLTSEFDLLNEPEQVVKKNMNYPGAKNNGNILSGQEAENPWKTSAKSANESHESKKTKPKIAENIASLTSPITGELLGDFGTWRKEAEIKKAAENQANQQNTGFIAVDMKEGAIIKRLKEQLVAHGAKGVIGLSRKFKIMDDDGSNTLSFDEFLKAFKELKLKDVSLEDVRKVFNIFDRQKQGVINFDNFLEGLVGPLNERRKRLVNMAFDVMDKDGNGVLEPYDVISAYDCSKHPAVMSGAKTKEEVLREFLDGFDIGGVVDGKVTRQEFENYYQKISASIDNDDYFELMIRNAWHISGGEGLSANTANRRVLAHRADGTQGVEEIRSDLGLKADDKKGIMARLQAQGVNVTKIDTTGAVEEDIRPATKSKPVNFPSIRSTANPQSVTPTNLLNSIKLNDPSITLVMPSASAQPFIIRPKSANAANSKSQIPNPKRAEQAPAVLAPASTINSGLQFIIKKLKDELKSRGANGFSGLQKKFRIMDDDGSKSLSQAEFRKSMNEMKLGLAEADIRRLFEFFDNDRSGYIEFNEFIQGIRDPLSERRLKLVRIAFSKIDTDGSGVVDAQEALALYDVSKHPEVMRGSMSKHDAIVEFLGSFEIGGDKNGFVTIDEFVNYYTNIGASIDNDDYFELMIRNAWHISGGEGLSANTANRRVLAHRADGTQGVEEIRSDLGLKADDKKGMMARLQAQGVNVTKIDTTGAVEDEDSINVIERQEEIESQVRELKKKAVFAFNEKRFNFAESNFQEIVSLLNIHYPQHPDHPEILKANKSIQLIRKKLESMIKSKK